MKLLGAAIFSVFLGFNDVAFGVCLNGNPSVEREFASSALVIEGVVKSSEPVPENENFMEGNRYLLEITRTLKGKHRPAIEVFSENSSGRFPLEVGAAYRLFLFEETGRWQVNNCGNSALSATPLNKCPTGNAVKSNRIGTAEQAVALAVPLLQKQFGADVIAEQKPFHAILEGNLWHIYGTLPKEAIGGTAEAEICRTTGEIMEIYHTQ